MLARGGLEVVFRGGELRLLSNGAAVLDHIFLDEAQGRLTAVYWRWLLLSGAERRDGFDAALRRPPSDPASPKATQFTARVERLAAATAAVERREREMNDRLADLYGLTPEERRLISRG